jgi:hypothetical protein
MSPEWAAVIVSVVVGLVGLYLGNSIRRQARVARETEAVEKRFAVYALLWCTTRAAAPMDTAVGRTSIDETGRRKLYDALTTWFFKDGGGMVLGEPARTIYLRAKENLGVEDLGRLYPESVRKCVEDSDDPAATRREIAVRQLSLLRTAMRAELGVFGEVYGDELHPVDRDFLRNCHARLWRKPWYSGDWRARWLRGDWRPMIAEWWRPHTPLEIRPSHPCGRADED